MVFGIILKGQLYLMTIDRVHFSLLKSLLRTSRQTKKTWVGLLRNPYRIIMCNDTLFNGFRITELFLCLNIRVSEKFRRNVHSRPRPRVNLESREKVRVSRTNTRLTSRNSSVLTPEVRTSGEERCLSVGPDKRKKELVNSLRETTKNFQKWGNSLQVTPNIRKIEV